MGATRVGFVEQGKFMQLLEKYPRFSAALVLKLSGELFRMQDQRASSVKVGAQSKVIRLRSSLPIIMGLMILMADCSIYTYLVMSLLK